MGYLLLPNFASLCYCIPVPQLMYPARILKASINYMANY